MELTGVRARHRYSLRARPRGDAIRVLEQLEGLRRSSFPELAVSLYIPVPDGASWGIVSDTARELAHAADLTPPQRRAVTRELPRLRRALEGEWRHVQGVAAFGARPMRVVVGLPDPVEARLVVAREAYLGPLEEQLTAHPPAIVAVVDKVDARIFVSVLDRVSLVRSLAGLPINRHRQGETSAEQWQRRQDEHTVRNLGRVAAAITRLAAFHPRSFERIRLAAPDEAAAMLISRLPTDLRARVVREADLSAYLGTGDLVNLLREGGRTGRAASA